MRLAGTAQVLIALCSSWASALRTFPSPVPAFLLWTACSASPVGAGGAPSAKARSCSAATAIIGTRLPVCSHLYIRSQFSADVAPRSPDARQEPVADALLVLPVAWKLPREKPLLVEEAPDQERQHDAEPEESPPGAERERHSEDVQR